ncbi:ABC transporter permease [Xylophilus sp.]|uniref:ABC transporter permease n=1 Tax=Xylophilus sp. TaxID=2653893 RepID=UPI0013BE8637|nr:ABC transporter permease [Xylophilus sp.]KAF1044488.1 MAG: Spermidine/putrescine transport system permease protein PotB [Xylophilus sp.]
MSLQTRSSLQGAWLVLPATLVVGLVLVVPTLLLMRQSLNAFDPVEIAREGFTLENYQRFFTDAYYRGVFFTTLKTAALCTLLGLLLGFPVAYRLARSRSGYKTLWLFLIFFPLLVGNTVRAAGWMALLGNTGIVNAMLGALGLIDAPLRLMYTPLAVVLGTTSVILPFMILTLHSVLEGIDLSLEEAAANLGASGWTGFRRVVLPLALPGVAAGVVLVFVMCMNAYATPVLLGGAGMTMMTPVLYSQITNLSNWPFGSALASILLCATLLCAVGANSFISRRYYRRAS